jgi:hypothetical protein
MGTTNWDILKFKYEVMGVSLEAISMDTGLSLPLIQRNARDWKQLPLVEDDGNALMSDAERAAKLHSVLKQSHLGPKYVELEMILLYKAIEIANNMNDSADNSNIMALKNLTDVLSNLLAQNPSLAPVKQSDGVGHPADNKWEINIITGGGVQENKTLNVVKQ